MQVPNFKFHENKFSVGHADTRGGQTDKATLTGAFRNNANAPQNNERMNERRNQQKKGKER
jgi:hypothetical protein